MLKKKDTPESREFWRLAEQTSEEVRQWPDWKRLHIDFESGVGSVPESKSRLELLFENAPE